MSTYVICSASEEEFTAEPLKLEDVPSNIMELQLHPDVHIFAQRDNFIPFKCQVPERFRHTLLTSPMFVVIHDKSVSPLDLFSVSKKKKLATKKKKISKVDCDDDEDEYADEADDEILT